MTGNVDVLVGTLGRAHGLRGEVTVRPTTDFVEERFAPGSVLTTQGRALSVRSHRWNQGLLLVSFDEVTSRSAAEDLRGGNLWAAVAEEALNGDAEEFHDRQLIGLAVRRVGSDDVVGRVSAVEHPPAQDLLVVSTAAGERLVPFVGELVPVVDLAGGFLEVADLPGLLSDLAEG